MPRNGVWMRSDRPPLAVVAGTRTSRDMTDVVQGGPCRTYTLPGTVSVVHERAFQRNERIASVLLCEGLETLGESCFCRSGIRRIVLPSSVKSVGRGAFNTCERLEHADFRAARGLKSLEKVTFNACKRLRRALLNEGLEKIEVQCFERSGVEELTIPGSVRRIEQAAFGQCDSLRRVHFLGAPGGRGLVIGKYAFARCTALEQVTFDEDSALEEVQFKAFFRSRLESFVAPPALRVIGDAAFEESRSLKDFRLNDDVQSLGWFCLWATGVTGLKLLPHVRMTRAQLGLSQDPRVLRLPEGLEVVGNSWFAGCGVEKVAVPASVRQLGNDVFFECRQLR